MKPSSKRSVLRTLSAALMLSAAALSGCAEDASDPAAAAEGPKRALFVVSNVDKMTAPGFERETGVWFSEVTHPYWALADAPDADFEIDIASPDGGRAAIDAFSVKLNLDDFLASGGTVYDSGDPGNERFLSDDATRGGVMVEDVEVVDDAGQTTVVQRYAFADTLPLAGVDPADYDLVFYAGGNGASYQFPDDAETHRVASEMYAAGKLVTAVCHGTAALLNPEREGGGYLVEGVRVTGFSTAEEEALGQLDVMPVLLEEEFPKRGAIYTAAPPWGEHVVVDGRIITGQNPTSARAVGEAIVEHFAPVE
jgi:putative intracellular protease/amidase